MMLGRLNSMSCKCQRARKRLTGATAEDQHRDLLVDDSDKETSIPPNGITSPGDVNEFEVDQQLKHEEGRFWIKR
ncbi:hypothetical protein GBA52_027201 [Prunus armeniaca]|nr:hypothetical protein GBA52_027201 [Prunus armeniaca]